MSLSALEASVYSWSVFPARAGMSRRAAALRLWSRCVPRASGDEPLTTLPAGAHEMCSPRERG